MNVIHVSGFLISLSLLSNFTHACPHNCSCENDILRCHGNGLPASIPNNVTKVLLHLFDLDNLTQYQFENISWRKVKMLDISADFGKSLKFKTGMFNGLDNLETLGIHGKELESIDKELFSEGLNITTLDLSYNQNLPVEPVTAAISDQSENGFTILANLENLNIAKLNRMFTTPVTLGKYFFKSVAWRETVKYLDLSDLNIASLDFKYFYRMCNVTEHVKLQRSPIVGLTHWINSTCTSLRTLDLSENSLPWAISGKYVNDKGNAFNCLSLVFFYNVQYLFINNIFNGVFTDLNVIDLSKCPFALQSVHLSRNNFKNCNFTTVIHQTTQERLQELDLSDNGMEYISPGVLSPSTNLQHLNLSVNKLYLMQEKYRDDFIKLFNSMSNLRYLYLSNNRLTNVPTDVFLNNSRLIVLDLSNNKISRISFKLDHMIKMGFLDLSGNEIKTIEDVTRLQLEALYNFRKLNVSQPIQMQVALTDNLFVCQCDAENVKLIKWIKTSPVVYRQKTGMKYECLLDGKHVDILKSAIKDTEQFCSLQQLLHLITIAIPTVAGVLLGVGGIVITLIRRSINQRKYKCVLKDIKNDRFPYRFLVFLSFCNEDGDLVIDEVYPQLKKTIREMTKSNKELIGIGDIHFRPGFTIRDESIKCIEESAVVMFFVSNIFCQKNWCKMELEEAYTQHKPIILVMLEKVNKEYMSPFLRKVFHRYAHASWVNDKNGGHIEPDWNILVESIITLAGKDKFENNETVPELVVEHYRLNSLNHEI